MNNLKKEMVEMDKFAAIWFVACYGIVLLVLYSVSGDLLLCFGALCMLYLPHITLMKDDFEDDEWGYEDEERDGVPGVRKDI